MRLVLPELRLSEQQTLRLMHCALALAFIAGIALAPRLWLSGLAGGRSYPLVPLLEGLRLGTGAELLLVAVLLLSLALQLAPRLPLWLRCAPIAVCLLLVALDMSRLQPWVYQYMLMLGLCAWGAAVPRFGSAALRGLSLIIAADYFWSGLQKLNAGFAQDVFPWFIEPLSCHFDPLTCAVIHKGWWLAALGEASLGLLLIFPATRRLGVIAALGMHVFILFCLGPFGHNWNNVVWPWNMLMALSALLLFWPRAAGNATWREILLPQRDAYGHAVALLLFGILPALSFFNLWDEYLSCSLYSGNVSKGTLVFDLRVERSMPAELRERSRVSGRGEFSIDIYGWSFDELNVPPYPERRIFLGIAREMHRRYASQPPGGTAKQLKLIVHEKGSLIDKPLSVTLSRRMLE